MTELTVTVPVNASQEAAFAAITQWAEQGRWMIGTRVWVSRGTGREVGDELSGFTGIGKLGFLDTMDITEFSDELVVVEHTGKVVRGSGWMGATDDGGRTAFVWGESVVVPFGRIGELGWRVVKPVLGAAVRSSLRSLAEQVESGQLPARTNRP